jgi:hypothetical protein
MSDVVPAAGLNTFVTPGNVDVTVIFLCSLVWP